MKGMIILSALLLALAACVPNPALKFPQDREVERTVEHRKAERTVEYRVQATLAANPTPQPPPTRTRHSPTGTPAPKFREDEIYPSPTPETPLARANKLFDCLQQDDGFIDLLVAAAAHRHDGSNAAKKAAESIFTDREYFVPMALDMIEESPEHFEWFVYMTSESCPT